MTIGEYVSLDRDPLAERTLAREPTPVDLRRNSLNRHPNPAVDSLLRRAGRLNRRADEPPLDRSACH
jgi:hypothetical protein